tara:strand:+ start:5125 stop:6636 length:1512 start_codon:yes stop_codon:yes gene_type:complete
MSALQQSGAISLIEIANEFGVSSGARSLKAFYRGGSNVSSTTVVTTSATNAPSNNTPVSNFAGVTGLTLSADLTTLSTDSSGRALIYTSSNSSTDRTTALNSTYSYEANDILEVYVKNSGGNTSIVTGTYTNGTISTSPLTRQGDNPGHATVTSTGFSVRATDPGANAQTSEISFFTTNITGAGVLDLTSITSNLNPVQQYMSAYVRVNPGSDGQAVTVVRDDGTLFTNNSAYAVNITGNATNTVQVGGTLTGAFPDSNNQYTCSYTPVSTDQTATPAPPTSDSAVSDFGGVTGLTCTRTTSTSTSTSVGNYVKVGSTQTNTSGTILSLPGASNAAGNPTRKARVRNESVGAQPVIERLETQYGSAPFVSSDEPNNVSIASGSVSSAYDVAQNATRYFKVRFSGAGGPSDQKASVEMQSVVTTTINTFTYSFTNNTGFPVTISGSGITSTTIPDGGTNNEAIVHPSGNFTIQYQVANAQALNGNIPESGAISLTNFYGTEDFS